MMGNITIKISSQGNNGIKKWNTIKTSSNGQSFFVIRKSKKDVHSETITVFPNEKQENKLTQFIWYWLLRMLVFIRII